MTDATDAKEAIMAKVLQQTSYDLANDNVKGVFNKYLNNDLSTFSSSDFPIDLFKDVRVRRLLEKYLIEQSIVILYKLKELSNNELVKRILNLRTLLYHNMLTNNIKTIKDIITNINKDIENTNNNSRQELRDLFEVSFKIALVDGTSDTTHKNKVNKVIIHVNNILNPSKMIEDTIEDTIEGGSSKKRTFKKTSTKRVVNGRSRVIYTGSRGAEYIKKNGQYIKLV